MEKAKKLERLNKNLFQPLGTNELRHVGGGILCFSQCGTQVDVQVDGAN
jgi:hypothetical protein